MKIAICSDSHDNLINIDAFLKYCKTEKIETIFHCGDWCAPSILPYFRKFFKGKICGIYGNVSADASTITKFAKESNIMIKQDGLAITLDKIKFLLVHYPELAKGLAKSEKYDIIFYGHNHKPWKEKIGETYLVNPGTLAGMFYRASFAIYDTTSKKLELKILDQL